MFSDQRERLENLIAETSEDDILGEIGYHNVLYWLNSFDKGLNYAFMDNDDVINGLKSIGKYLSPKRYLDKEDLKKEINDFIDFWM